MSRAACLTAAAVLCSTISCRESPSPGPVQPETAVPAVSSRPPRPAGSPRSQSELPTTDGALAVSSFLGLYQLAVKSDATSAPPPMALVSLLSTHAQYFGMLDDYERALQAADRFVRLAPTAPEPYLQRASARQSLHQFDAALADLAQAERLAADRDTVADGRARVLQALGRYDEALAIRERLVAKRATTPWLAAQAALVGEMGRTSEAERLFARAENSFEDVSPFPLAWLYFQHGLFEERAGRPSTARELYEAAHERLPIYAPVVGHLAALVASAGDRRRAVALLEPVAASSDDPEYWAQLGVLLKQTGDPRRGDELIEQARRRYAELVRRYPAAFADHAARFWLGAGGDPKRALGLARQNLGHRHTRDAYDLVIEAALAAAAPDAACAAADAALKLPYTTPALHVRASQAFARCDRRARADAELLAANAGGAPSVR